MMKKFLAGICMLILLAAFISAEEPASPPNSFTLHLSPLDANAESQLLKVGDMNMKFSSQADKQIWLTYTKSGESFSLTKMHGWYSLVSGNAGITGAGIATPAQIPQDPVQAAVDAIIASGYDNVPLLILRNDGSDEYTTLGNTIIKLCQSKPELKGELADIIRAYYETKGSGILEKSGAFSDCLT